MMTKKFRRVLVSEKSHTNFPAAEKHVRELRANRHDLVHLSRQLKRGGKRFKYIVRVYDVEQLA